MSGKVNAETYSVYPSGLACADLNDHKATAEYSVEAREAIQSGADKGEWAQQAGKEICSELKAKIVLD